jgi:hypothetical protein
MGLMNTMMEFMVDRMDKAEKETMMPKMMTTMMPEWLV